ncbi:MAG: DUF2079 domain-containing protein, partial [Chloroflexota bacterium]|nr:DUF2079 domain-containing protein [Chloroflexota bacterium]
FGALVALGALIWVAICFKIILPHYNIGVAGGNNYWYRYSWLGATPTEAIVQAVTHPLLVLNYLFSPGRVGYLALVLRTGGALWLLAPALMLAAAPDLAVNLLSTHSEQYSGFFQYNAVILTCALVAATYGVAGLARARLRAQRDPDPARLASARIGVGAAMRAVRVGGWRAAPAHVERAIGQARALWSALLERIPLPVRWLQALVVAWLLAASVMNLMAVGRVQPFWEAGDAPSASESTRIVAVNQLLARIPADASVCATDTIDPHVSDRYDLYLAPDTLCYQAQYVAMDVINSIPDVEVFNALMLFQMRHSDHYVLVGETHGVVVLHRVGAPLTPLPGLEQLQG